MQAEPVRYERQLHRLETLTDCVYGVAMVLVLSWLPLPEESSRGAGGSMWLLDLFTEFPGNLVGVLIGQVFVLLYWRRNASPATPSGKTRLSLSGAFCADTEHGSGSQGGSRELSMPMPVRVVIPLLLSGLCLFPGTSRANSDDWIQETGDVLQIALPVVAGLSTVGMRDWEGTRQFAYAFGTSWTATYTLKYTAGKLRPDAGARSSWPSGHTMGAFAGASFIYTRFGRVFGVPSYLLAGFTGYSRVNADKHFVDDVLAGASISMLSNWYHVTPGPHRVDFSSLPLEGGYGVAMRMRFGGPRSPAVLSPAGTKDPGVTPANAGLQREDDPGRVSYTFLFGPAFLTSNRLLSAKSGSSEVRLEEFDKIDDPTTTSAVIVAVRVAPRHKVSGFVWPFESRDFATLTENVPTRLDTLQAGTRVRSIYRMYDTRLQYRFAVIERSPWNVQLGADVNLRHTFTRFSDPDGPFLVEQSDTVVLPLVGLEANVELAPSVTLGTTVSWIQWSGDMVLDAAIYGGYRFNRHWQAGLGYGYYGQEIDTEELSNEVRYHVMHMSLTHHF